MVGSKPKEININTLFAKEMSMNSKRFSLANPSKSYVNNVTKQIKSTLTPSNDKKDFQQSNMETSHCDRGTADITDRPTSNI